MVDQQHGDKFNNRSQRTSLTDDQANASPRRCAIGSAASELDDRKSDVAAGGIPLFDLFDELVPLSG